MKVQCKNVLEVNEINDLNYNPCNLKGYNFDYVVVKKELKNDFLASDLFHKCVVYQLVTNGKLLYY